MKNLNGVQVDVDKQLRFFMKEKVGASAIDLAKSMAILFPSQTIFPFLTFFYTNSGNQLKKHPKL